LNSNENIFPDSATYGRKPERSRKNSTNPTPQLKLAHEAVEN